MRPRRFNDLVHWQTVSGQPLLVNGLTLTPQSRVLTVRFLWSIFVWHWPTAVVIEQNGQVQRLPIVDLTRIMQIGLCGFGMVIISIASLMQFSRRKEHAS
jgi:hypothetical protein